MTHAQHTHGPWRVHAQFDSDPHLNGKRSLIRQHNYDGSTEVIASSIRGPENARLIAAAPDMLVALERAYQKLGFWMDEDKWDDGDESTMEQIWVAIAKAKGE